MCFNNFLFNDLCLMNYRTSLVAKSNCSLLSRRCLSLIMWRTGVLYMKMTPLLRMTGKVLGGITVSQPIQLYTFHEVKSKREKKKENKETSDFRPWAASGTSNRSRAGADRYAGRGSSQYSASDSGALPCHWVVQ